jgi:hypothetical protein
LKTATNQSELLKNKVVREIIVINRHIIHVCKENRQTRKIYWTVTYKSRVSEKIKMGSKIDNAQESTKAQVTQHNDNDTKTCICTLIRQKIYRFLRTEKKSLAGEAILKSLSSNDNFIVFVAMWTSR